VIHAATPASVELSRNDPLQMLDIIVAGTRRVLDFAASHGTGKFLLTSSGAVYGRQRSDITHLPEDYTGGPDTMDASSAYGEGKRLAEFLAATYSRQHGLEAKIARCFAFVGPHLPLDLQYAVGNFIRDAVAGGPIVVRGDGTPYRSYLYAADLAIWLWTILFRGVSCRPYNVGSDDDVTIGHLASCVGQIVGDVVVEVLERPVPDRMRERYVPQVSRAKQELGLTACITLPEAIKRTVAFVRQQDPLRGATMDTGDCEV
jgi:dTDP-glucose 4,6-dehydratase